ncbi:hypothetical protein COO60DRAFT_1643817 [Scenedesmus sp. NREL 46B-D3]|nr:hypothetical protein COO60DRAFT_1643817 [Scenedesmus sp. NREL 46B-D3]
MSAPSFVIPRLSGIDLDAQNLVRGSAVPPPKDAKAQPFAAPMKPSLTSRPTMPVAIETSLRAGAVARDAKDGKLGAKWHLEGRGPYMHAAPVVADNPASAASSALRPQQQRRRDDEGQLLMNVSAIDRPLLADVRLGPGIGSRAKLGSAMLLNPASGQQQPSFVGSDQQQVATQFREPFKSDNAPMLFNASSTREPVPVGDSELRAPRFSRMRGEHLRGGPAKGLFNPSSAFEQPLAGTHAPAAQLTRYRGPERVTRMLINESVRPELAHMIPLDEQPRGATSRMHDTVKSAQQTVEEAALHAIGRSIRNIDAESSMLAAPVTRDGKQREGARDIIAPTEPSAFVPLQALPAGGLATRFATPQQPT